MTYWNYGFFILANLLIGFNSYLLFCALNKFEKADFFKTIIGSSVIFFSQIIVFEILLGLFGVLNFFNLLGVILIFSLVIFLLFRKKLRLFFCKNSFSKFTIDRKFIFFFVFVFSPVVVVLLIKFFNAAFQLPFEYDNVAYHLPFVVEWLTTGSLTKLYYSAFAGPIAYYPSNFELLDLFVILPFKNDFFVNLINLPFFVLFGVTLFSVLRKLNVSPYISVLSTAILFYMPVFLRQAGVPLVDLFFSFVFVVSIYFLIDLSKEGFSENRTSVILFGLSLGLFIGTKYLGIVYSVPLVLMFFLIVLKKNGFIKNSLLFLGSVFLTGGFFYIRNWVNSGNPLFPVDVKIFGIQIFDGYPKMNELVSSTSLLASIRDVSSIKIFAKIFYFMTSISGYVLLISAFFGILFFAWHLVKRTNKSKELSSIFVFSILAVFYFILYLKAPYSYRDMTPNVRYSMMFLSCGVINFGILLHLLNRSKYKIIATVSCVFIPIILFYSLFSLVLFSPREILYNDKIILDFVILKQFSVYFVFLILSMIGFVIFCFLFKRKILHFLIGVLLLGLLWNFVSFSSYQRELLGEYSYKNWYVSDYKLVNLLDVAFWLNKKDPTANIAYTGFNFHYHLYGRRFERSVDYVNINDCFSCRYVDFKYYSDSIRRNPSYDSWLLNLEKFKKDYVVVDPEMMSQVKNYEFGWMNENPGKFQLVYQVGDAYLFKIK